MVIRGILVLALIASCKKGPSCAEQKRVAGDAIRNARILTSDTTREQYNFDEVSKRLEALRAFQVKLVAGITLAQNTAGCEPELICCKKAAEWIAANAAAPEGERPLWRLPAFGWTNPSHATAELVKQLATYDEGASTLASLLQKGGDASLDDVTAACTQANTALTLARSKSTNAIATAVEAVEAERNERAEQLKVANGRATIFLAWEDAITRNAKFEVPEPLPSEPKTITEAKAKAKSIQSCLK